MTCYLRHMTWLFDEVGLAPKGSGNREAMDAALRRALALDSSLRCPEVWAAVKALPEERRADLPSQVIVELARQGTGSTS